jgi:hypothetical protein
VQPIRIEGRLAAVIATAVIAVSGLFVFFDWTSGTRSTVVWTFARQPDGVVHVDSLVATPNGFALLARPVEGDMTLWTSSNGIAWSGRGISGSPNRLLVDGDDLLAFAGRWVMRLDRDGDLRPEVSRLNLPLLVRVGYGSGRAGLVVGEDGLVAQAFTGDVFWAPNGSGQEAGATGFELVVAAPMWGEAIGMPADATCDPPTLSSVDVPPIVATPTGFITLVSVDGADPFGIWPVCEPEAWFSPDGKAWERLSDGNPFGDGAYIYDMAWRDGRLIAVGGVGIDEGALWHSGDGRSWTRAKPLPADDDFELREVAAGALGWVVLGEWSHGPGLTGWVSPDGECWKPLPGHVSPRQAAVGNNRIVLAEHGAFPLMWVGIAAGGRQLGCD